MEKVNLVQGVATSMPVANINTDAIIPAAFMRSVNADLGKALFARQRYDSNGAEIPDFILNREPYRRSRILVGDGNFGCGSSREAAVWALYQFGIRCIVAESFGDIFYENSFKNGLLLVTLPRSELVRLHARLAEANDPTLRVDLERCVIAAPKGEDIAFSVPESRRQALLQGLDEIGQTLARASAIDAFQAQLRAEQPWLFMR